jgi:hypothetical protein
MSKTESEDFPFFRNEIKDYPETMDKPLDTADAPGRADSEIADDEHIGEITGQGADAIKKRKAGLAS